MAQPKAQPTREDPVQVDSRHYTVVAEDDKVRVLRIAYGPQEKSVMHGHPAAVAIFLNDARFRFTMPDGRTEERQAGAGQVMLTPAEDHLPENLGDTRAEVILVELKS